MPFTPTDLYLTSGTFSLSNSTWKDSVHKYDSSSFYNWEQDNLPLYDLEERDNFLFERLGNVTSSITGMMLTVSDTGVNNTSIFSTLSGVIDALPGTITFPIIIEVASSGTLGELKLENIQFEGDTAGIEIINRGFAKVLSASSTPSASITTLDSGSSAIIQFASTDTSNTMGDSESIGASCTVWGNSPNAQYDWWDEYTRAFALTPEWSKYSDASPKTITISSNIKDAGRGFLTTTADNFAVSIYQDFSTSSDIVTLNEGTGDVVQRPPIDSGTTARTTGLVYANSLSNITINDCTGKVYIRGFCVDGGNKADINAAGGAQNTKKGISINNSNVVIENCTSIRCTEAGLEAVNSDVTLNRGFLAFHNYELSSGSRHLDTKVTTNPTAGIRAINSHLLLSSTIEDDYGIPLDSPFCSYRNMVGVDLQNSQITTPSVFRKGRNIDGTEVSISRGSQTLVLQAFFNKHEGIKAYNSLIDTSQRIAAFQNQIGISLNNSQCKVAEITVDHNAEQGIKATNSLINYNKDATLAGYTAGPFYPVTNFVGNGQHVTLQENSEFIPTYVQGMDTVYERLEFSGHHQMATRQGDSLTKTSLPGVVVTNGSYMDSVCTRGVLPTANADSNQFLVDSPIKGALFQVTNGSTLKLQSHGSDNTYLFGPYSWQKQQDIAGLYAGQSSNIHIAGPTTMMQMGINVLAEDNSTIEFAPHERDGIIDASGWGLLDPDNHTRVQLHSTRANLVVNNNSNLSMKNLGDYHAYWNGKYFLSNDDADFNDTDSFGTSAFHYNGSMQFFPNPYASYTTLNLIEQATPIDNGGSYTRSFSTMAGGANISTVSWGGMCVRAVNDSNVEATNVNFPCGWINASEAYYDASTDGGCALLRIWNIADQSHLNASYLSVEETHPQDASSSYYGPSSVYTSGASVVLSGAPISTNDTSSLSVLDSFGSGKDTGTGVGFYGKTLPENIGPFRIYISPTAKAKFLGYPKSAGGFYNADSGISMGFNFAPEATLETGPPYQVIAQGYNPSGDCSATTNATNFSNVSSVYQDLGFSGYITTLPAEQQVTNDSSSFFYTDSMIATNTQDNIWLDKSAINTFANAKNGTLGTSGRKKIFNYYEATVNYPGESFWEHPAGLGIGFGSASLFDLNRHL